ncbi:GNAT family N-acetyltransferase [Ferrimonas balearica]|uniref:GNAT family N-acetyltransferase n=1 Tax=Ferrimonas balearica TaxID=44012 RepID=UPI001C986B31|nr:GNAT family N-acetyltransferase [Ferrimonas balearica]MBY6225446.1 GNAT family N-acetyltransferase [Ferrimonas balearica]
MTLLPLSHRPDTLDTIARWHFAEWGPLYPNETLADFRRGLVESMVVGAVPGTWLWLRDNDVVATGSLLAKDMTTNAELSPWLANVYVVPSWRGQGIGAAVVKAVMAEARRLGLPRLYLFTEDQQGFYQRLGWALHHRERYHGVEVSVMVCELEELT